MAVRISKPSLPNTRSTFDGNSSVSISGAGGAALRTKTPSVFQDMSSLEVPNTLKGAFAWCKYLGNWSPIHRAYAEAMTELPTTDILIKDRSEISEPLRAILEKRKAETSSENRIKRLVDEEWKFREIAKEIFRSLAIYDNAVTLLNFPFEKKLVCEQCGSKANARTAPWRLRGADFILKCPDCDHEGEATVIDEELPNPEGVRLTTLDMECIDSKFHPLTGKTYLYYTIPKTLVDLIIEGDRDIICDTPKEIVDTVLASQDEDLYASNEGQPRVKLEEGFYFLSKKPGLPATETQGLSFPTFAATFKDYWLLLTMRKAQEVIANGWIVPRRFLYPETSAAAGNIFEMLNISEYMGTIRQEIQKHERDPNYQSVIPFPIGQLNLGGDAKGLMLSQELRILIESICATLQCPLEFLYGGMSFSSSSVTAKKMQVQLEGARLNVLEVLQWALDAISKRYALPPTIVEFSSFRLADDLQYIQLLLSLQQSNLTSVRRLHEEMGIDSTSELEAILRDVQFQSNVQKEMGKTQAEIESLMVGEAPAAAQAQGELLSLQKHITGMVELQQFLKSKPELMSFVQGQPELYNQIFGQGEGSEAAPLRGGTEVPDPEKHAPGADQQTLHDMTQALSPEVLKDFLEMLLDADIAERQAVLDDIRHNLGEAAYKQVSSKLHEMDMITMLSPEDRPSSTERMVPF